MNATAPRPMLLMHIEDNKDHAEIIREVVNEHKLVETIIQCSDGESALSYFDNQRTRENDSVIPDIILLDLQLPEMSGVEFLQKIKSDSLFGKIPVVILSAKNDKESINHAYQNGAAGFITKPSEFCELLIKLAEFTSYWTLTSEIPRMN